MDMVLASLDPLRVNTYPGRGFAIGLNETGESLRIIYWITARSAPSKNCVLKSTYGRIYTAAADPSKDHGNPELTLYHATRGHSGWHIVSNGNQTDALVKQVALEDNFETVLKRKEWQYEPDPSHTPRITAIATIKNRPIIKMAIARKVTVAGREECTPDFFAYLDFPRGAGYCLTTYAGDGNPLPSFEGSPYLVPLIGGVERLAKTFQEALPQEHFVSLAVKSVNCKTGETEDVKIVNKYEKV